ncbi:hypothetical protein [Frigoribacterium faeni]|uniref:Gram-positive cocci surface proteins LPxTG domain-containing protein n=1 Tax=Frigoribacterium faeni TaxID=145483 RepID=A0A7W3JFL6_9MICO|nr:hypothetical protein [Frigoribacterium faeni]MBA8811913.1 hypothetical protein [Frigoribacterium faeni]BFF12898.1 hypothetical protein GCM10025699_42010 [Microbacterium flavescens]GEK83763.1 hypothetical protein FFA01_20720 [Frigoribacterium faeni]
MSRSHRLRTGAGTAALVAAIVLAPTTAFAASASDASAAPASAAPVETPVEATPSAEPTPAVETPAVETPAAETPATGTGTDVVLGQRPAAVEPAPAAETPATAATPAPSATPTPAPTSVVVVPGPTAEPTVELYSSYVTPGETTTADAYGFTPGDAVTVTVDGPAVTDDTVFTVYSYEKDFVFDSDGYVTFDMDIPADLALGTITISVSDASGLSTSTDVEVREPIPAPTLVAPSGATAGIVPIVGSDAAPGSAALVLVADADLFEDSIAFSSLSSDVTAPGDGASAAVARAVAAAEADAEDDEDIPYDTEPVEYDPDFGFALGIVPVAADGTFSVDFDLPEGEYGTSGLFIIEDEFGSMSEASDPALFSVGAAVVAPTPADPTPGATSPVVPAGNTTVVQRPGTLAYTGSEQGAWLAGAAALLALGTALVAAPRLRRRLGR